ncbi:MAG: signal peptidase I [Clostridia bacterium]|nr:signal peptidase I [Clostridia bacterium]
MSEKYLREQPDQPVGTENSDGKGKDKKGKEKKSLGREILSWVLTILVAVAAALVIRTLLFEPIRVDGASMNDTLANGEAMFVSKLDYASTWLSFPWQSDEAKESAPRFTTGFGAPKQFDVVIVRYPGRGDTNFVKRLIGMPGDRVSIQEGYLYVNGTRYEEDYISDEYRVSGGSNGWTYDEVYIPKKGDVLSLAYLDENQTRVGLTVAGEQWPWRGICSEAVSDDGDRLSYSHSGVLTLNGTDISGDADTIKGLVGKEFKLEKDLYFVMGDHRNNSNDSRAQGPISRDMIVGHVRFVFFPFNQIRTVK